MKKLILFAVFFIFIFYVIGLDVFENRDLDESDWDNMAKVGDCKIRLEFVNDDVSRARGLSNRDALCDECGMMFLFPAKEEQTFWMKDMRFNLDIIWISDYEVVGIEKNVPYDFKGTLSSSNSVDKVLEINSGKVEECNIKKGSILKYVN